jgi:hypothetical protein
MKLPFVDAPYILIDFIKVTPAFWHGIYACLQTIHLEIIIIFHLLINTYTSWHNGHNIQIASNK